MVGSLKMNTTLEYSTRVVQEGDRRCKKSTLNDLAYLTPLRIPLTNPVIVSCPFVSKISKVANRPKVRTHNSKGVTKKVSGWTYPRPDFSRNGRILRQIVVFTFPK